MKERGWRVNQVEQATGISYRTLSDYLAGRKEISLRHMVELTEFLRVRADDLRGSGGANERPAPTELPPIEPFLAAVDLTLGGPHRQRRA